MTLPSGQFDCKIGNPLTQETAFMPYTIKSPRIVFVRNTFRSLARGLFPLLTRTKITGLENFPKNGPLILVGNHTGAMEVVLMGTYSPKPIEFMGAMEMPWNGWMETVIDWYGLIPVYRGYTSDSTAKRVLDPPQNSKSLI